MSKLELPGLKPIDGNKKRVIFECGFAVMIILIVSTYLFGITFFEVPEDNSRVVDTILGFLLGSVISPIIIWAFKNSKHTVDKELSTLNQQPVKEIKNEIE